MRALLLISLLALVVAGAFLLQSVRYGSLVEARTTPTLPGTENDLVLEIGGGPPPPAPERWPARGAGAGPPDGNRVPPTPHEDDRLGLDGEPAPGPAEDLPRVVVKPGQSLSSIAKRHYGSASPNVVRDIARANEIANPNKVREGTSLALPSVAGGRKRL